MEVKINYKKYTWHINQSFIGNSISQAYIDEGHSWEIFEWRKRVLKTTKSLWANSADQPTKLLNLPFQELWILCPLLTFFWKEATAPLISFRLSWSPLENKFVFAFHKFKKLFPIQVPLLLIKTQNKSLLIWSFRTRAIIVVRHY